jgi:hypothetical protein
VDQATGNVAVSWYDTRNDPGFGPGDRDGAANTDAEMYASVSLDGGKTWEQNIQVAPSPSNATNVNTNGGFQFGDYSGLDFYNNVFYPCWADNSVTLPGGNGFNFDIATAAVSSVLTPPSDQFELNETSDKATNFGVLTTEQTFTGLTIAIHSNNLPDYDWYRWTAGISGTFTAKMTTQITQGGLELQVFKLSGNTLVSLGSNTNPKAKIKQISAAVQAGDTIFVEVKGHNYKPGKFGVGVYDLDITLA